MREKLLVFQVNYSIHSKETSSHRLKAGFFNRSFVPLFLRELRWRCRHLGHHGLCNNEILVVSPDDGSVEEVFARTRPKVPRHCKVKIEDIQPLAIDHLLIKEKNDEKENYDEKEEG